jgi:hypothetical protein
MRSLARAFQGRAKDHRRIVGGLFFLTACSRNVGSSPDASPALAIVDASLVPQAEKTRYFGSIYSE